MRALWAVGIGLLASIAMGALRVRNLPLDDTYIHLDYGIDFHPTRIFSFQNGIRDTGTSSWLWTLLCIVVVQLRLPECFALITISVVVLCSILWLTMASSLARCRRTCRCGRSGPSLPRCSWP